MKMKCCVCDAEMVPGLAEWHWQCNGCEYEAASFAPAINDTVFHSAIDEAARASGLRSLRERNFAELLLLIERHAPQAEHTRLLEVGAAHGWFLRMASGRFDVLGIEPDHAVCQMAREQGVAVLEGYFPDILAPQEKFGVIVFNDVFEHLPDVAKALEACRRHLNEGGLLILNIPSSDGFFYRIARMLKRMGFGGAFERMWQTGFPSPHLHYFGKKNLARFLERYEFAKIAGGSLPSVRKQGLHDRISHAGTISKPAGLFIYLCVLAALPFIGLFSSDIAVVIAGKRSG
jgi:SAM-dependent methyltransferase